MVQLLSTRRCLSGDLERFIGASLGGRSRDSASSFGLPSFRGRLQGFGALSARCGPALLCSVAVSTSCAISSGRRPNMSSRRSAMTSIAFTYPRAQRKTLRTTNTIERLHEEFRRRVKTQSSLPNEDAALTLLFSLVASGKSGCGRSTAGGRSPPCSGSTPREQHNDPARRLLSP
jgi:hypothetical protein